MENFQKYVEKKENNKIVEFGNNINNGFWQDFLSLLNNSDGLSELLDVPKNKVGTWRKKIIEALKEYEDNKKEYLVNKKNKIIRTGLPKNL